jgi:hypothetical protein
MPAYAWDFCSVKALSARLSWLSCGELVLRDRRSGNPAILLRPGNWEIAKPPANGKANSTDEGR